MAVPWDLHYDRRVSEAFLAHFLEGGVAHSLVEYARFAPYAVDLQMRHNPKTHADHATLYVGLTSVLDVMTGKHGLHLVGHKTATGGLYGFDDAWTKPMTVSDLDAKWRRVEDYLEAILPKAWAKHASKEGAVQAAASVFESQERIMFDREVALHFKTTLVKERIFQEETSALVKAVQGIDGVPGKPPSSFGGECDLLALDAQGRLLAVEVKPRGTGTIVWSGVQATVYAGLFERWIRTPPAPPLTANTQPTDPPVQILRGMLDQRTRLGLAPHSRPELAEQPVVVPVVALQRGFSSKYLERLKLVQQAVLKADCGNPALEIFEVSMAGRMDRLA